MRIGYRNLADVNGDNRLSQDEFAVVLHLIEKVKLGHAIPRTLPDGLVPPSARPGGSSSFGGGSNHTSLEEVVCSYSYEDFSDGS